MEKRKMSFNCYQKQGGKDVLIYSCFDAPEIYKKLAMCYFWKYTAKSPCYKALKNVNNYDGTHTITFYTDNGCKDVFVVEV